MSKNKKKKIAPRPRPRPPADERPPAIPEADTELTTGPKLKKVSKRGGGDFNIEMKIPKELVKQGVMYGYKKGGQI